MTKKPLRILKKLCELCNSSLMNHCELKNIFNHFKKIFAHFAETFATLREKNFKIFLPLKSASSAKSARTFFIINFQKPLRSLH